MKVETATHSGHKEPSDQKMQGLQEEFDAI